MQIGNRQFDTANRCYIMGILNVTPDSFSDGGRFQEADKALYHVEEMIEEGADIIDVGGQSTRPEYREISETEEIERVTPVIEKIKTRFDIPVSIDTYKSSVAKAGLQAGADLVNDIWGLQYDRKMAEVIAEAGAVCCLTHNKKDAVYQNLITDVMNDLEKKLHLAEQAGISKEKIILDPGVGFGKTYEQNLEIIAKLDSFNRLGYPLLLGVSKKSVIGLTLELPVEERLEGTLAITAAGVMKGCSFIRVHDVKENARVIKMTEAIKKYE